MMKILCVASHDQDIKIYMRRTVFLTACKDLDLNTLGMSAKYVLGTLRMLNESISKLHQEKKITLKPVELTMCIT